MKLSAYGKQNREAIRRAQGERDPAAPVIATRPNKYGNKFAEVDGQRFDSKREKDRYRELTILASGGAIQDLQRQVAFSLDVAGVHICKYVADFTYWENGRQVVEDAKGVRTSVYKLKKLLMLAVHGIEIQEV